MNSENSRTSDNHVLVLKVAHKLDLRRGQKKWCFIKFIKFIKFVKFII